MEAEKKSGPNPWIAIGISIASFVISSSISFTTLFYTQLYTSEAVYALFLDYAGSGDDMVADIALVNKGNQNVVISELRFVIPRTSYEHMALQALQIGANAPASPIVLEPREVKHLQIRHLWKSIPKEKLPSRSSLGGIEVTVHLRFKTIGSSAKIQETTMPLVELGLRDDEFPVWSRIGIEDGPVQIRE